MDDVFHDDVDDDEGGEVGRESRGGTERRGCRRGGQQQDSMRPLASSPPTLVHGRVSGSLPGTHTKATLPSKYGLHPPKS